MAASEDLEVAGLELEHYRAGDERKIPGLSAGRHHSQLFTARRYARPPLNVGSLDGGLRSSKVSQVQVTSQTLLKDCQVATKAKA
jgi:hypothetical protein